MGHPGPSVIMRVLIRQKEGAKEEEPERRQCEEDCPMLLPVETEEESPSKKAGVLWKMERARKWISPLEPPGGDRPADTLILVQ